MDSHQQQFTSLPAEQVRMVDIQNCLVKITHKVTISEKKSGFSTFRLQVEVPNTPSIRCFREMDPLSILLFKKGISDIF